MRQKNTVGIISIFAMLGFVTQASAEIAECYVMPEPAEGVGEMVMTQEGDITYTLPDVPKVLFFTSCAIAENDTVNCHLECDGGRLAITHSPDQLSVTSTIRIESMQFDSVLFQPPMEADGAQLYGTFVLKPAPLEQCRDMENRTPDIELQAGDVNVLVETLEENLIKGGYLLGAADIIFDGRTRDALMAYQRDAGLPPSGRAGPDVRRQLATDSVLAFGGC